MKRFLIALLIISALVLVMYNETIFNNINEYIIWEKQSIREASTSNHEKQKTDKSIYIDLEGAILYLFRDGSVVKKYPIAVGKSHTPSPIGIWKVVYKAKHWGTGFGTRWMGLDVQWGKYGIHGTNKPGSIGSAASHGCFRMNNRNIEELYDLVPIGTPVVVSGGPYGNLGSYLRKLDPGDRGSHVLEVQKRLNIQGYYDGPLDGHFGEITKAAVIKYKKEKGLPVNHQVDYETYKNLGIILFE